MFATYKLYYRPVVKSSFCRSSEKLGIEDTDLFASTSTVFVVIIEDSLSVSVWGYSLLVGRCYIISLDTKKKKKLIKTPHHITLSYNTYI